MKLAVGLQDFIVVLAVYTLIVLQLPGFADDPGVGWHLKTGELVATQQLIPDYDPFLAAPAQGALRSWVSDQWLSDMVLYLVYQDGAFGINGWPALYAFLTIIYLITFFVVLYWGVLRTTGAALPTSIAVFFAFKLAQLHFILRPVLFGFLFFALTYVLLYRVIAALRRDEGRSLSVTIHYLVLPPIFTIWANMHPSFVLGLLLLALAPLSALCDRFFLGRHISANSIVRLVGLLSLCGLATFINPYGIDLHESIFSLSQSDYFMHLNEEWLSTSFGSFEGELVLYIVGTIVISLVFGGLSHLRWTFFELLLLTVFGILGIKAVRMLPFFGIAVSVPLVYALSNLAYAKLFSATGRAKNLPRLLLALELRERQTTRGIVVLLLLIGGVFWQVRERGTLPLYGDGYGPSSTRYPYKAVSLLKEQSTLRDSESVVLAPPEWGGFITWYGGVKTRPVLDDRNTLLGEGIYKDFYGAAHSGDEFAQFAQDHRARYILLPEGAAVATLLMSSDKVQLLYQDSLSKLFVVTP